MSAQTVSTCVVCGAQTDRFLCGDERAVSGCLGNLLRDLGNCAALVEELDTTISRCDKIGGASVGFVSNGGDEQPMPINLAATESKLLLRDRLVSWCRDLWEANAVHDEDGTIPPLDLNPGVLAASRWLMRHPTWIALHRAADELYDQVRETIRLAWRAVDSAPGKVYIGICSAPIEVDGVFEQCPEKLFAREGDWEKRCPACSTIHDVGERQDVLSAAAEVRYVEIGLLVGLVRANGERVTADMLRSLLRRKRIAAYVELTEDDSGAGVTDVNGWFVRPWVPRKDPVAGRLFRVGEVLDAITGRYVRRTSQAA
jgi:hypothetical protein